MSRNARLEAFYRTTSANAVLRPTSIQRAAVAPTVDTEHMVLSPPPTIVNLSFLRSGKEFFSNAQRDTAVQKAKASAAVSQWKNPGPKKSRYARKRAFYFATQEAAASVSAVMTKRTSS